jgi:hypothetical protein
MSQRRTDRFSPIERRIFLIYVTVLALKRYAENVFIVVATFFLFAIKILFSRAQKG